MAKREKKSMKKEKVQKKVETKGTDLDEDINLYFEKAKNYLKKIDNGYWVVLGIVLAIIIIVSLSLYYIKVSNNFTYQGVEFKKTYFGKIPFYSAQIPVINSQGKVVSITNIDFRGNPKDLNDVSYAIQGPIKFVKNKIVYAVYDKDLEICEFNGVAATDLGEFLGVLGLNRTGAVNDVEHKVNSSLVYANCENNPNNTVILLKSGEENSIKQTAQNCYVLTSKDCDVLKVIERFKLEVLKDYLGRFVKV